MERDNASVILKITPTLPLKRTGTWRMQMAEISPYTILSTVQSWSTLNTLVGRMML